MQVEREREGKLLELEQERDHRLRLEDQVDRLKQLRDRQIVELDRLNSRQDRAQVAEREAEAEREKREKAEEQADRLRQLSNQQSSEIERLQDVIRENTNLSVEVDTQMQREREAREAAEDKADKLN